MSADVLSDDRVVVSQDISQSVFCIIEIVLFIMKINSMAVLLDKHIIR